MSYSLKDFGSEIYHAFVNFLMKVPLGVVRLLTMRLFLGKLGKHSFFSRNVEVRCPYRIHVGSNTSVNKRVLLDGRGGTVKIGDSVDIAQEVNIWTLQHDFNSKTYNPVGAGVVIDDHVWIASRATILPGVHIGRGAVVASCAVVTKNVESMTVVAGVPAKPIGIRKIVGNYKLGKKHLL